MSKPKLLDQRRNTIQVKHYSMRIEEAYVHGSNDLSFSTESVTHYTWEKTKSVNFFHILLLRERYLLLLKMTYS